MNKLYIGFMSGTSLDGVDASLIKTDSKNDFTPIENLHIPYKENFRNKLKKLLDFKINIDFFDIEQELTSLHINATAKLLQKAKLKNSDIEALGFHGQTIYHNPENFITWQIGNPFVLAAKTGIKTVYDFRRRDMAYGGQGAPLIPIFHKVIMSDEDLPVAVVNIGGVANITYIDKNELIAFDTGPGNALIDDACLKYYGEAYDKGGEIARKGKPDIQLVDKVLKKEYFTRLYPKSLDRNKFKRVFEKLYSSPSHNENFISTLTYLTAVSITTSLKILPKTPGKIYLCGGGAHNSYLVELIGDMVNKYDTFIEILNISQKASLNPDFIESQGFAYLAARFCNSLPSSFPSTTGVSKPSICGAVVEV